MKGENYLYDTSVYKITACDKTTNNFIMEEVIK